MKFLAGETGKTPRQTYPVSWLHKKCNMCKLLEIKYHTILIKYTLPLKPILVAKIIKGTGTPHI